MNTIPQPHSRPQAGFTLIELSIVLVIIGLIAGGVLVGQDMIKAAEIRSQVAQIEGYDQAFNAFRVKYAALPGDMSNGVNFGLNAAPATSGQSSATGRGNGNSLIESSGSSATVGYLGEPVMSFVHLTQAGLIKDGIAFTSYDPMTALTISNTTMPAAKLGRGNRIYPISVSGVNNFLIGNFSGAIATGTGAFPAGGSTDAITPNEAFQIDSKIDDGLPNTGLVRPVTILVAAANAAAAGEAGASDAGVAGAGAAGDCWTTTAPVAYLTAGTATRDVAGCQLRIRAQF